MAADPSAADGARQAEAAGQALRIRLRGRLLEFLKFRVLAAQEGFFTGFGGAEATGGDPGPAASRVRQWLHGLGVREFDPLADDDLLAVLATARRLYLD
ncbi:hypothetical protein [Cyanobium sp. NIES-981]|uniref:hypothetical protein n=1 Tax=Cyanobium sp. NIES-981 TaxID=1851505 RepID=UPI0007DE008A|nr:hypothetical protein [Cyanobium sp. NIES-981]SBO41935.1 putative DNA polymerase N-terminal domain protein [Cyanobium sp. NIES-981]